MVTLWLLLLMFFPAVTLFVAPANPREMQSTSRLASPQADQGVQRDERRSSGNPTRRKQPLRKPDVLYYPTPDETVIEMLRLADIKPGDVLYDLGSGDGRIPIVAAQHYGIRSVGIEIDPRMVIVAEERARQANVAALVSFRNADMFRSNISEATVVTLYLSDRLNLLLRPKLLRELRPGSRILSHDFDMGDWKPERKIRVPWQKDLFRTIYIWRVPRQNRKR